jgi:hypothetical protein
LINPERKATADPSTLRFAQDDRIAEKNSTSTFDEASARESSSVFSVEPAQGCRGDGGAADGRRVHGAAGAQAGRPHPEPLGTHRVGPFGLLQPLVDGAKSFLKEDIIPTGVYRPLLSAGAHHLAGVRAHVDRCGAVRRAERGPGGFDLFEISNLNIGLLVILGVTSIGVYGIALAGWSSNNKYSLLGSLGLRRS